MPIYEEECPRCGERIEYYSRETAVTKICPKDSQAMERVVSLTNMHTFRPYVTPHITGKPIYIDSPGEERRLLKKHGLRKADDIETQRQSRAKPAIHLNESKVRDILAQSEAHRLREGPHYDPGVFRKRPLQDQ